MKENISTDGAPGSATNQTQGNGLLEQRNLSPLSKIEQVSNLLKIKDDETSEELEAAAATGDILDSVDAQGLATEKGAEGVQERGEDAQYEVSAGLGEPDEPLPASEGLNLKELAKQLGTTAKKLYELQIPLDGSGEMVTLGTLKSAYRNQNEEQAEFAGRETSLIEQETSLLRGQQEIALLQNELRGVLTPERLEQLQRKQALHEETERRAMFNILPNLKDEGAFTSWRSDAVDLMGEYGFAPHEAVITDHRIVKMLDDMMKMKSRMQKLSEFKPDKLAVPSAPKQTGRKVRPPKNKIIERAKASNNTSDKVAGVSALLRG